MRRTMNVLRIMTAGLALSLGGTVAHADKAINNHFPIHFVLTPAQCSQVTATVTGDGTDHQLIRVSKNADGTYMIDDFEGFLSRGFVACLR